MGGGGFSMEPENPTLDRYVLQLTGKERPRVCFLGQAGGESPDYLVRFYRDFVALDCHPSHLSLFAPHTADLADFLLSQDVIYVGGGNTKSMLALWREWGVDAILRRAWEQGIVLAGVSAGAICWFEQGSTDSIPGRLSALPCLSFLPGSCAPHFDGEAERRPTYRQMIATGEILPGYGIDDGAAIHFIGREFHRIVASRADARAYRVEKVGDDVVEIPFEQENS
jgi:peptidase E